jgi:hypothetical protein
VTRCVEVGLLMFECQQPTRHFIIFCSHCQIIKFLRCFFTKTLSEPAKVSTNSPVSEGVGKRRTFKVVFLEASVISVNHCTVRGETRVS